MQADRGTYPEQKTLALRIVFKEPIPLPREVLLPDSRETIAEFDWIPNTGSMSESLLRHEKERMAEEGVVFKGRRTIGGVKEDWEIFIEPEKVKEIKIVEIDPLQRHDEEADESPETLDLLKHYQKVEST